MDYNYDLFEKIKTFMRKNKSRFYFGALYTLAAIIVGVAIYYFININNVYNRYDTVNVALKLGAQGKVNCFGSSEELDENENVWVTSDPSIIDVDSNGIAIAKKTGNADITQISKDGEVAICRIAVKKKLNNNDINATDIKVNGKESLDGNLVAKDKNDDSIYFIINDEDDFEISDEDLFEFEDEEFDFEESDFEIEDFEENVEEDFEIEENSEDEDFDIEEVEETDDEFDFEVEDIEDEILDDEGNYEIDEGVYDIDSDQAETTCDGNEIDDADECDEETEECEIDVDDSDLCDAPESDDVFQDVDDEEIINDEIEMEEEELILDTEEVTLALDEAPSNVSMSNINNDVINKHMIYLDNNNKRKSMTNMSTISSSNTYKLEDNKSSVIYEVENSNIININKDGIITPKNVGETTVTVKASDGKSKKVKVNVKNSAKVASNIKFNIENKSLNYGDIIAPNITAVNDNEVLPSYILTSSNTNVINIENGLIVAKNPGTAIINAVSNNNILASVTLTVKNVEINSIKFNKPEIVLPVGTTYELSYTVSPANATNKNVTLITSNNEVVSISGNKIKGVSSGNAIITIRTSNGKTSTCKVKVETLEPSSIILSRNLASLKPGETVKVTATVVPNTATNKKITWKTSDYNVATVNNGVITAVSSGNATITAETENNVKAQVPVKVQSNIVRVSNVSVKGNDIKKIDGKNKIILKKGKSTQISATITPSEATNKNVKYTTSNSKVATIDEDGKIKAIANGKATITARSVTNSSINEKIIVTVVPNENYIDINKKDFKDYTKEFELRFSSKGNGLYMKNFDYIGRDYYFSGQRTSSNLRVIRVPKRKLYDSSSEKYEYFTINNVGNGQSFAVDGDYIWTTGNSVKNKGRQLIRIKFENGKTKSWSKADVKLSIYNGNKRLIDPEVSIDQDNNMLATKFGSYVVVWDKEKLEKMKDNADNSAIIYTFTIPSASDDQTSLKNYYKDGSKIYKKGSQIYNGYFYQLYGSKKGGTVVRVFDMQGNKVAEAKTKSKLGTASGIKIIKNKVVIGTVKNNKNQLYKLG